MNEEQKQNEGQEMDFVTFEPSAEPEGAMDSEPDVYEQYLGDKAVRDAKQLEDLEKKRFQGVRSGEVQITSELGSEYLSKLDSWSQTKQKQAWEKFKNIPVENTQRMAAFVKYYEEECPEVTLYLRYLEKADPA